MGAPGIFELLIIAAIALMSLAPIALLVWLIVWMMRDRKD